MCYWFSHNEQEAQWQSDIIYNLQLHTGVELENTRGSLEISENSERLNTMETIMTALFFLEQGVMIYYNSLTLET